MCRTVLHDLSVLAVHDNAKSIAEQWKLLYIFGSKVEEFDCVRIKLRTRVSHNFRLLYL